MKKVLVCAPQHDSKMYCWDEWKTNVHNFTYPNYDVFLADNSSGDEFSKKIKEEGFLVERVKNKKGVMHRLADSHNACRSFALTGEYDYILHLETDIIPPIDIIEMLLNSGKKICSASYDIWHGKLRRAMIQLDEDFDRYKNAYRTISFAEEQEPHVFNGMIRRVYHAGLGCILISRDILEKIPFRYIDKMGLSADTWFANDCYKQDIPIYLDSTIQCKHLNFNWLADKKEI